MVIKRYVKGIAFSVLMLSIVLIAMAALPSITYLPNTATVDDVVGAQRTFSFTSNQSMNSTWLLNGTTVQTNTSETTSSYTNTSAVLGYWNLSVNVWNENTNVVNTWWWNVTNPPPSISRDPAADPTTTQGNTQFFNVSSNQDAYFRWYIDNVLVQDNGTNPASTTVSYMNNTAGVGTYNVRVDINNTNGTNSTSWTWTVTTSPGPNPVSGLTATRGATWINWTWTNSTSGNFNYTMVKINGSFQTNTSNNYYNYTTFGVGTSNNISLQTVDTSGIINSTVVTNTTSTLNTQGGTNVIVVPVSNVNVTFSQVSGDGNTSASVSSTNTWGGHSFSKIGSYYNIELSGATPSGNITVELGYDPTGVYNESGIRLYHWSLTTSIWDDVTTYVDTTNNKVRGNVTSFSPVVAGVPPGPAISAKSPTNAAVQTIGVASQNFTVTFNQTVNIYWYINGSQISSNSSVTSSYYLNNSPTTGTWNITVVANNLNGTVSNTWNWTVRPKTYETGNRIWDAKKEMNLTYTWNPMSFYAFYYDLDNNVGNESLKIILDSNTDRNIQENTLQYSTAPDNVSFKYKKWGFYNVIGFMAEKYFAAYTASSTGITGGTVLSPIGNKQLHKILMDDDTQRPIYAGSTLTLSEGYVVKIKDVSIGAGSASVWLSLLKDGGEIYSDIKGEGETFVYAPSKVGAVSNLPIIAVRVDKIFRGKEANAAFLKGIFQLSESFTSINTGNRYGIMEITGASDNGITMVNKNSFSLSPGTVNDVMGDIKIIVADNSSVLRFAPMVKKTGTYEVRGTISQSTDTSFDWNPLNFEGFYYDINEDVGSEKLTMIRSGRTISEKTLVYTSTPQSVSFKYKNFGSYNVIGFMAEKYFAGYTTNSTGITSSAISTISNKQLHRVLIDDDTQRPIYAGSTLTLSEGYVVKIKDVSIGAGSASVWLSLLKDGGEIYSDIKGEGETFKYEPSKVGAVSNLPIIAVRVDKIFRGKEANVAFIKGAFQLSESFTSVKQNDRYGIMEVTAISDTSIEMKNPSSVSLSSNSVVEVMGNIKFRVADSSDVRFYPFILVNGSIASANQLAIDAPSAPSVRDTIIITITAGGTPVPGATVSFDNNDIGTTNSTGKLNYTLTRSGVHNITATKLGYEKAIKTIQVSEYVDNRLSIEVPAIIDQGVPVSIKVLSNGTAIPGASVAFDNSAIGTTDASGILNYTFSVSGTHNLGASKDKYISVVREISIRMPFSEYKAIDINIAPSTVFTNEQTVIRSNITNVGTKADAKPVELIFNGTVVDNKSIALAPGEIKEINFTRKEALPGNYTVEILGQKGLLEVREEPLNFLLIGGIATGFGALIIYLLTAKSKISLELLRQKLSSLGKSGKKVPEVPVEKK